MKHIRSKQLKKSHATARTQKRTVKNSPRGFTIVEVMIVLAIAGLIMLIVFLAIPALQR